MAITSFCTFRKIRSGKGLLELGSGFNVQVFVLGQIIKRLYIDNPCIIVNIILNCWSVEVIWASVTKLPRQPH